MNDASDKAERLAKALRDNLKRRKAQARGKDSAPGKVRVQTASDD